MDPHRIIEGTGEEIAKYTHDHPGERFRLIALPASDESIKKAGPSAAGWKDLERFIDSMEHKLRALPLGATSTEAL